MEKLSPKLKQVNREKIEYMGVGFMKVSFGMSHYQFIQLGVRENMTSVGRKIVNFANNNKKKDLIFPGIVISHSSHLFLF